MKILSIEEKAKMFDELVSKYLGNDFRQKWIDLEWCIVKSDVQNKSLLNINKGVGKGRQLVYRLYY